MKVMKAFYCILLTLLINLISINSFSVMTFGKFPKENFDKIDKKLNDLDKKITIIETRLGKSLDLVKKQIFDKQGGPSKIEIFPIKIYRQILNGINYKIITAVKDLDKKRIELFNSIVFAGPFINSSSDSETPKITLEEKIDNENKIYHEKDQKVLDLLQDFLLDYFDTSNCDLERVKSIVTSSEVDGEFLYLINCDVIEEGRSINRYIIISRDSKGLSLTKIYDF